MSGDDWETPFEAPLPPCRHCGLGVEKVGGVWIHRSLGRRQCSTLDSVAEPDVRYKGD